MRNRTKIHKIIKPLFHQNLLKSHKSILFNNCTKTQNLKVDKTINLQNIQKHKIKKYRKQLVLKLNKKHKIIKSIKRLFSSLVIIL